MIILVLLEVFLADGVRSRFETRRRLYRLAGYGRITAALLAARGAVMTST